MATETSKSSNGKVWRAIKQLIPFQPSPRTARAPPALFNNDVRVHAGQVLDRPSSSPVEPSENSPFTKDEKSVNFGYAVDLKKHYEVEKELARGGNGVVFLAVKTDTGVKYAMKSIPKVLQDPKISEKKRDEHRESIKREVEVMRRLRGCLNVASLEDVFEDDSQVYLIMEYCSGGELHHAIGSRHYSERTVASYMRAVLRTLAQCHAQKILHRDIKPGNFLLSSNNEDAPLKAIDFGLAVFFDEKSLPRTDLGLEGTPWFMPPEVLSSQVYPASDLWAAGVMCAQLLTGRFPFDDRSSPYSPSLSKVWKSILCDGLDTSKREWDGVSDEAKDFVQKLLDKDHKKRPSAKQALRHPWLKGSIKERSKGKPLSLAVVQRIQRYGQGSYFKRSVLDFIAAELLSETSSHMDREQENIIPLQRDGVPIISHARASPLEYLYARLSLVDKDLIDRDVLAQGLSDLGYRLSAAEVERLLDQLDPSNTGKVAKSQLAASQIDWSQLQVNQTERWLALAKKAFSQLDTDKDGVLSSEDLMALLRHKLPPGEVDAAVRHALAEATRKREGSQGGRDASLHSLSGAGDSNHGESSSHASDSVKGGLNFKQFLRVLNVGSADSLDLFDDRFGSFGSPEALSQLERVIEKSVKGGNMYENRANNIHLTPVQEASSIF